MSSPIQDFLPHHIQIPCPTCHQPVRRLSPHWALGWLKASGRSIRATARLMGISHVYLHQMLHGRKAFTEEMESRFLKATA